MFGSKDKGTVIAKGLKIVGSVAAEGLVEVHGQIEGELQGTSLVIAKGARVAGTITARRIVVDGQVEGPIKGGEVILKSHANVAGDIRHSSLSIESGAIFEGCSTRETENREAAHVGKRAHKDRNKIAFGGGVNRFPNVATVPPSRSDILLVTPNRSKSLARQEAFIAPHKASYGSLVVRHLRVLSARFGSLSRLRPPEIGSVPCWQFRLAHEAVLNRRFLG